MQQHQDSLRVPRVDSVQHILNTTSTFDYKGGGEQHGVSEVQDMIAELRCQTQPCSLRPPQKALQPAVAVTARLSRPLTLLACSSLSLVMG